MRSAKAALRNAANHAVRLHGQRKRKIGSWAIAPGERDSSFSARYPEIPSLTQWWRQDKFWVPAHSAHGFPSIVVTTKANADAWHARLDEFGVTHIMCNDEAGYSLFDAITVIHAPNDRNSQLFGHPDLTPELAGWLADPTPLGCAHSDAYSKFVHFPLCRTEDVWGMLGANAWDDARALMRDLTPRGEVDMTTWELFWRLLDGGEVAQAARVADLGTPLEPRASTWRTQTRLRKQFTDPRISEVVTEHVPVRTMSKPLWIREKRHKRRHHFDIASLYGVVSAVWRKHASDFDLFRDLAREMLAQMVRAEMDYERMYLTCFWAWTTPYTYDIMMFLIGNNLLYSTNAQWRTILKEITATITQSWFFPLTNVQHVAAAYFLNAEDLIGYPDANPDAGAIVLEVLEYATDNFKGYSMPDGTGGRSVASYIEQFRQGARTFLEPMYQEHADKAKTFEEMLSTRVAWGPGGVAGRRARELFGPKIAPPNAAKGYVYAMTEAAPWREGWGTTFVETCDKSDERGATRTISATDMRDQLSELVVYKPIHNRFVSVGCDIGESPNQCMERNLRLTAASRGHDNYTYDGKVLMCWDWQAFDHYMMNAERACILDAIRELTEQYVKGQERIDILRELDLLDTGVEELIYRSQSYADERYKSAVDEIIAASEGRAERLPGHAGLTAVKVRYPNGQQSGRQTTLDGNTIVGQVRLLVRDAEMLGRGAHLRHRVSTFRCNRADDVNEVFSAYKLATEAVSTMLRQGHRANPKKQVAQWRSSVYLRNLYAGGSLRAFPARAVYAAATSGPDKGAGSESAFHERLSSVTKGLDMWARRGGWLPMAEALYADAKAFFSKTRIWLPRRDRAGRMFVRVKVQDKVIEASALHGGLGILPPGVYEYDFRYKCAPIERWQRLATSWSNDLDRYVARLAREAPGIADLDVVARARFEEQTKIPVDDRMSSEFRERWAKARVHQGGDGQTRFVERQRAVASCMKHVHRDDRDGFGPNRWMGSVILGCARAFDRALMRARMDVNDTNIKLELDAFRGRPAYGLLDHEWHGYAAVAISRARSLREKCEIARVAASATKAGRDFWDTSVNWPLDLRLRHLQGDIAPNSAWDKIMPPTWAGWAANTLHYALALMMDDYGDEFSVYESARFCAYVSSEAAKIFLQRYPELCLH